MKYNRLRYYRLKMNIEEEQGKGRLRKILIYEIDSIMRMACVREREK